MSSLPIFIGSEGLENHCNLAEQVNRPVETLARIVLPNGSQSSRRQPSNLKSSNWSSCSPTLPFFSQFCVEPVAGIQFPGLKNGVIEVIETGDVLQECRVTPNTLPLEYAYHWLDSGGRIVSNSALLHKEYLLRARDEGIFTCVAVPTKPGALRVERQVNLVVSRKLKTRSSCTHTHSILFLFVGWQEKHLLRSF
ncbi:unnamed protein product [Protopolystoma xenopodis]|uniref:Ig-like domain-containing protein n=1 Tax=Protopolystoma xenopodis TaxID=117903 RepID=A0A448WJH1_9PLAT|nr:unnamed protein product [Protopolystoma xenopodis]